METGCNRKIEDIVWSIWRHIAEVCIATQEKKMISKEYLHERFTYREGELYWKTVYSNRLKIGQLAGDCDGSGYRRIMLGKKHYKMHILIWIMYYGNIKEGLIIDHIDRDKSNNKIENLRIVTKSQNNRNREAKGISFDKARNKWRAQISINNKTVMLGRFETETEALLAYKEAYDSLF